MYAPVSSLSTQVDIACLDLSFISVLKVIPAVMRVLRPGPGAELLVLVKPQFEAGREHVKSGGVVRDPKVGRARGAHGVHIGGVHGCPFSGRLVPSLRSCMSVTPAH